MRKKILIVLMLFCTADAFAQKAGGKSAFYMIPQAGLLNGDHFVSAQVMLVGGLEKNGWGLGLGSAIDYYKVRSIPVFLDIRREITKKQWPVFAYLNMGINMAAPLDFQYSRPVSGWGTGKSRFSNGLFTEFGLGYALWNKKRQGVVLGMGYSIKTITEAYNETIFQDFPPFTGSTTNERKFLYRLNRVVLKLGFRL